MRSLCLVKLQHQPVQPPDPLRVELHKARYLINFSATARANSHRQQLLSPFPVRQIQLGRWSKL